VIVVLAAIAASAYFGPAQLWTIIGVVLTAIGLVGAYVIRLKTARKDKKEDGLSLYVHFVDDLQVELKRLHDVLTEERAMTAKTVRDRDVQIEKLEMKALALQQLIEELQNGSK
jgi:hypothetical protein